MFNYSKQRKYCPICEQYREEYASSCGANYYIKGHGENIYYKESCRWCDSEYYLLAGNNGILEMRLIGMSEDEAISTRLKNAASYKLLRGLTQDEIESIVNHCKMIYSMDISDLVIPAENVKQSDLAMHSCWMS